MSGGMIIGVDGGGTHTVAVAARADGTVVATARGEGINYNNIGMARARETLYGVVSRLTQAPGLCDAEMCVGLSALDAAADERTVRAFAGDRFAPERLDLQSDAYTALLGFSLGRPGLIAICGTGSILLLLDGEGRQQVVGGWGHLLSDVGSAYSLALDGLRAAIAAWEGLGPDTALSGEAMRHFALETPRALIDRVYAPDSTPDRIAQFARPLLAQAEQGDAVALALVQSHMERMAAQAAVLLRPHPGIRNVGLYGGVFLHSALARARFSEALRARIPEATISLPEYPPEIGAVLHCLLKRGPLQADVLARLRESYRQHPNTATSEGGYAYASAGTIL